MRDSLGVTAAMTRRSQLALTVIAIAGCRPAAHPLLQAISDSEPPSRGTLMDSLCAPSEGEPSCTRRIESHYLSEAAGRAERRGDSIILHLAGGASAIYRDSLVEGPTAIVYGYRGYVPSIGYFVLDTQFYARGGYLLVSGETGHSTPIDGPPRVSPDHGRVAAASVDLEAQFSSTTLTIWRVLPDSLAFEWMHNFIQDGRVTDSTYGP